MFVATVFSKTVSVSVLSVVIEEEGGLREGDGWEVSRAGGGWDGSTEVGLVGGKEGR